MRLAVLYALLAALATIANIASQVSAIAVYSGPYSVYLSVLFGTFVGLAAKYGLDKRYIFRFEATGLAHDGRVFTLYAVMGVLTTLLFWATEFAFHAYFRTDAMRYLGGVLGLGIGYFAKYHLDRRYVFVQPGDRVVR